VKEKTLSMLRYELGTKRKNQESSQDFAPKNPQKDK